MIIKESQVNTIIIDKSEFITSDFNEKYEVIEQDGKLYTVRERE